MDKCGLIPWLAEATRLKASDLFLTVGEAPTLKVYGTFRKAADEVLSAEKMEAIIEAMLNQEQLKEFRGGKEVDVGLEVTGLSRFHHHPAPR